jgi:hypothetical protein
MTLAILLLALLAGQKPEVFTYKLSGQQAGAPHGFNWNDDSSPPPGSSVRIWRNSGSEVWAIWPDGTKRRLVWPTAEPIDVPAVQTKCDPTAEENSPEMDACFSGEWPYFFPDRIVVTCADKSRILLTAEDGKQWCHKVQP